MSWSGFQVGVRAAFEAGSRPGRIDAVEGARGVAMSLVFLVHLLEFLCRKAPQGSLDSQAIEWIYPLGNLASVFFVILTGCFMYRSLLAAPVSYSTFLARRFSRIYSVFSVVLTVYVGLSFVFPSESKLPDNPVEATFYVLANLLLLPGVFPIQPIISVSWTLSYVALYCLILPPLVELTGMRTWQPRQRALFFLVSAVTWASIAGFTGTFPPRLALLPVGALGQEALAWRKANPGRKPWLEPASIVVAILALALKYWFVHADHISVFSIGKGLHQLLLSSICLLCASFALFSDQFRMSGALSSAPLRYLGNMSFSYYLTHGLVINFLTLFGPVVARVAQFPIGFWLMVPAAFAMTLIPAAILFLTVERHSVKWARPTVSIAVPRSMSQAA